MMGMAKVCALSAAVSLLGCTDGDLGNTQQPIINGTVSADGMFVATGALVSDDGVGGFAANCTGTLISPTMVVTAAHCLEGGTVPSFSLKNRIQEAGVADVVAGSRMVVHPEYPAGNGDLGNDHDIGVLILAQPITDVKPELLPWQEEVNTIAAGATVTLVGYGQTTNQAHGAGVKYHGDASVLEVSVGELAVSNPNEPQSCFGDSGGPVLEDFGKGRRIIGVISRGRAATCTEGGFHTRVDSHLAWLHMQADDVPCGSGLSPVCADGDGGGCSVSAAGRGSLAATFLMLAMLGLLAVRRRLPAH